MNTLLLLAALVGQAAEPELDQALLKEVITASRQTAERFQTDTARWTARHPLSGGSVVDVEVERGAQAVSLAFSVTTRGRTIRPCTVLIRDELWYVDDGRTRAKYRPYEALLPVPNAVHYIATSWPHAFDQLVTDNDAVLSLQPLDEHRVAVRLRLSEPDRKYREAMLAKHEEFHATLAAIGKPVLSELLNQIETLKDQLKSGDKLVVDRTTGILLDRGKPPFQVEIVGFGWRDAADQPQFDVDPATWKDRTQPYSTEELPDVVQFVHSPFWKPGVPTGATELVLVNIRTGVIKRAPFQHGGAMPGSFSVDRKAIFIAGMISEAGTHALFKIDLATGENSFVSDPLSQQGMWMSPTLSPDGNLLAASHLFQGEGIASQVHLFDLQSAKATALGKPLDVAFLNWHPKGQSLICRRREDNLTNNTSKSTIIQIDLDGTVHDLVAGEMPCVLPTLSRILFKDSEDGQRWKTCDLNGADVQPFSDGFVGFGFPAASRDGRLIMMDFNGKNGPQPCLVDLTSHQVRPIQVPPGLWSVPAWQ